jgi:hypothetical protein
MAVVPSDLALLGERGSLAVRVRLHGEMLNAFLVYQAGYDGIEAGFNYLLPEVRLLGEVPNGVVYDGSGNIVRLVGSSTRTLIDLDLELVYTIIFGQEFRTFFNMDLVNVTGLTADADFYDSVTLVGAAAFDRLGRRSEGFVSTASGNQLPAIPPDRSVVPLWSSMHFLALGLALLLMSRLLLTRH